ncbi:hypothetical protein H3V53_36060 [Paraburkholderia bengalensis]|uniref:Uncharacterized protein n=1 Tax=Paraburkholderia bengalensis TaxID=2747562 RepID=A0ABU8J315_9BURK
MNATHLVEWELCHLERLVSHMSTAAQFPATYWEARLSALTRLAVIANHRARIERLKKMLPHVESSAMAA